jgi:nitrite reductase/ring-hydroxylating ferredoxin subunit
MATNLLHYFTFGAPTPSAASTPEKEKPVRALPASWYTSPTMFSLERRAIFSRRWLFLTHSSRLKSPGDWLRYNIAGFDIILLKDRSNTINAFHNVCRHRAHPVIDKEGGSGNSRILACRYHGWSYGLDGKLAKAPGYQGLEFDKEVNGLFGIHVRIDRNGFVWVNMDAGEVPEVSFEEYFENVDVQQRYIDSGIEFGDYELDHVYEIEGKMPFSCPASPDMAGVVQCSRTHIRSRPFQLENPRRQLQRMLPLPHNTPRRPFVPQSRDFRFHAQRRTHPAPLQTDRRAGESRCGHAQHILFPECEYERLVSLSS